jgi:hypothetical protein
VFGGAFDTCAVLRNCQAAPSSTVNAGDGDSLSAAGATIGARAASGASQHNSEARKLECSISLAIH